MDLIRSRGLASKMTFKRAKFLVNSTKTSRRLEHVRIYLETACNLRQAAKISVAKTQQSISRPIWPMTCAELTIRTGSLLQFHYFHIIILITAWNFHLFSLLFQEFRL